MITSLSKSLHHNHNDDGNVNTTKALVISYIWRYIFLGGEKTRENVCWGSRWSLGEVWLFLFQEIVSHKLLKRTSFGLMHQVVQLDMAMTMVENMNTNAIVSFFRKLSPTNSGKELLSVWSWCTSAPSCSANYGNGNAWKYEYDCDCFSFRKLSPSKLRQRTSFAFSLMVIYCCTKFSS